MDLKLLKQLLSSMFARRMPYLITDPANNRWIYTSIPVDEMAVGRAGTGAVHVLEFLTEKYRTVFDTFPLLSERPLLIELVPFLKVVNHAEDPLLRLDNDHDLMLVAGETCERCGSVIDPGAIESYMTPVETYRRWDEEQVTPFRLIDAGDEHSEFENVATVYPTDSSSTSIIRSFTGPIESLNAIEKLAIVRIDGYDHPSFKEYIKKMDPNTRKLSMVILKDRQLARAIFEYEDTDLKVTSMRPGTVWFP